MADGDESYQLVMPFVACKSLGGPYDDASFAAGLQFGEMITNLAQVPRKPTYSQQVVSELAQQADLAAMRYGYQMNYEHESPDWIVVYFRLL